MARTLIRNTVTVTLFRKGDENGDKYSMGTVDGAYDYIQKALAKPGNNITAYAVESINYYPIDESNPGGQLFGGMVHHNYQEIKPEIQSELAKLFR